MIEQLFNLIQQESKTEIIDNPAIPNEQNNEAVGLATESIHNGLQGALANGELKSVLGLFTGNSDVSTSNPLVGGMTDNFIGSLMKKFGLDSSAATGIASSLIPSILGKLVNRTNDPNDKGFDINNIIGSLTGSHSNASGVSLPGLSNSQSVGGIDFGGILKNLTSGGLDANHDGHVGFDDIAGMISNAASGAQQNQQSQGGGGILGMLKGFLGN